MSQSCIQSLLPRASPAQSRALSSWVLPQLEAFLCRRAQGAWIALASPAAHSEPGLEAPQKQWFHLRHNAAQLHPTSKGWTCLPGPSRTRQAVSLSLCLCQAPPIFPGGQLCTSLHLTAFQRQGQTWALIFGGFFSHHHFHREKKKVCSEPLQGELNQGSFPSVKHQPSPCQPVAGTSLFPSSQSPTPLSSLPGCRFPPLRLTRPVSCL